MCVTDQRPRVGFGPFVQQHFGHTMVAAVCCHMQRCKVVQCNVINLCVVLQKLLDTVHVVPLCCHVDWRQTILQERKSRNPQTCTFTCLINFRLENNILQVHCKGTHNKSRRCLFHCALSLGGLPWSLPGWGIHGLAGSL